MTKKRLPCIYKATSRSTGKSYIGQSMNGLLPRKNHHTTTSLKHLFYNLTKFHKALYVLGPSDFDWEVVFEIIDPALSYQQVVDTLNAKEIEFIELYNSIEEGYNDKPGGGNYVRANKNEKGFITYSERRRLNKEQKFIAKMKELWKDRTKQLQKLEEEYKQPTPSKCQKKPKHLNNSIRESKRKGVVNS